MHRVAVTLTLLLLLAACSAQQPAPKSVSISASASVASAPLTAPAPPVSSAPKELQVGLWSWTSPEVQRGPMAAWDVGDVTGAHIYIRDPSTTRELVSATEPLHVAQWWPDGQGLLLWHLWGYCNSCNADGVRLAALSLQGNLTDLSNVNAEAGGFAWNPDGHRLLIGTGGDRFVIEGDPKVLVCDLQTVSCLKLPRPAGSLDVTPSWSPDGRFIVFARAPAPSPGADMNATVSAWQESLNIWIAHSDGTGQQLLDTPGGSYPTWSNDGRMVSFVHAGHRWRHDLYSAANTDSGEVVAGAQGRGWISYLSTDPAG